MNKNFVDALNNVLTNSSSNISVTENGAIGYKTTGKKILDLNFQVPSLRGMSDQEVVNRFTEAYLEDPIVATLWLFYARDAREGLGERRLFRTCLSFLHNKVKDMNAFVRLIPEYGRYDDLYTLVSLGHKTEVMAFIKEQLAKDIVAEQAGKPVSLLAKWLKSVNTSSAESRKMAMDTCKALGLTPEKYRKVLARLRKYIDVTEVKMSANQFDKIDYSAVPSKASLNYKEAFKRHDGERYEAFINQVNKGGAKINASVLYPHEIVHKYLTGDSWSLRIKNSLDQSLEALWKNLPNLVGDNEGTLVVADGSGSMTSTIPNSQVSAWEVAHGLALYFAQRAKGAFKDTYITFSEKPQLVRVGSGTLWQDLQITARHTECANTNIEATFDLILKTAVANNMRQEDLPKNILVISDMEFDSCSCSNSYRGGWAYGSGGLDRNLFKQIEAKFRAAGYKMPRLVFWNVNSRTNTIPVRENELGVALVSGFSVNILKMVMNGETDPYINLLKTLFSERYQAVIQFLTNEKRK